MAGGSATPPSSRSSGATSPPPPPPHGRGWSATNLRPSPPLRPCLAFSPVPYSRPGPRLSYKEDGLILDVIEAYFCTVKPRNTVNSGECRSGTVPVLSLSVSPLLNFYLCSISGGGRFGSSQRTY